MRDERGDIRRHKEAPHITTPAVNLVLCYWSLVKVQLDLSIFIYMDVLKGFLKFVASAYLNE